ncbi:hypothetical protein, partial [Streptococcus pneumoniae]
LGEKRNHPGSKLRQGFWMVFRLGVHNWGSKILSDENFRTLFILIHLSLKTIKSILILFGLLFTYCTKI